MSVARSGASTGLRTSIVVPSFNQAQFLERTLSSLFAQRNLGEGELEVIVMDGGSTDGSREIIERYSNKIAYWTSEPDDGQTAALAAGFSRATGDIFGWLCSDDFLEPDTIREVIDIFARHPEAQFIYGDSCWIDRDDNRLRWKKEIPFNWFIWVYDYNYIPQPSAFWRRDLYEQVGGMDTRFDLAMDASLWGRFAQKSKPLHFARQWSRMRSYPEQKNRRLRAQSNREDLQIRAELGWRVEPPAYRMIMRVLAKAMRIAWRAANRSYL